MTTQRHELVYLAAGSSFSIHSSHGNQTLIAKLIRNWLAKGLPCVFARQLENESDEINLGLSLLHEGKKQAIGLKVKQHTVLQYQLLPQLIDMKYFFNEYYGVDPSSEGCDFSSIRVYGSFLFHYLSGEPYVNKNSDLDLLIDYPGCSLQALNELIAILAKHFKRRIDGEVRFPAFGDLPIKELVDVYAEKILLKKRDRVELLARTVLYECYPTLCSD